MTRHQPPAAPPGDPLAGLRDIHLPVEPGWWPPAPGWWMVTAAFAAVAVWGARRGLAWHRRRAPRRAALRELAAIEARVAAGARADAVLAEASALLRRVALVRHADEHVAGLTGERWLEFLDGRAREGGFRDGPGACLTTAPYQSRAQIDPGPVLALVRRWVEHNA